MTRPRRSPASRLLLGALALSVMAAPQLSAGCAASFDPSSKLTGLRVLTVIADEPFAQAGDDVELRMEYVDAYVDPDTGEPSARPVQIMWLGGCFDPEGDLYYGCYAELAELFEGLRGGGPPPEGLIAAGPGLDRFTLHLPDDIVTRRPVPEWGPHYGIAFVFFAACAGRIGVVEAESGGKAGSFPLGCFDESGNRLGADSFVPGYTQIYAFGDGRTNPNPPVDGLLFDGASVSEDLAAEPVVSTCPITEDERRTRSCGQEDPFVECDAHEIEVAVGSAVADIDPDATDPDGKALHEVVWVDYYADGGDIESDAMLVFDASKGLIDDSSTRWIPPSEPGRVTIWAVVHDARGGSSVVRRTVRVE